MPSALGGPSPATAIARLIEMGVEPDDSFERRTNHPLRAVTGDAQLATLISLDTGRPHLLLDAAPIVYSTAESSTVASARASPVSPWRTR